MMLGVSSDVHFKCLKCKKPTDNIKFMRIGTLGKKKGVCLGCFTKKQKWLAQRGLPLDEYYPSNRQ